jgi:REP element-mobilizing transposase RayT
MSIWSGPSPFHSPTRLCVFKHLPKFNLPGSAHFVTTNAHQNNSLFADPFCAITVLEELAFYRLEYGFKVIGYVVMPTHFQCIVWWNETAKRKPTIGKIMQGIKGSSSRRIVDHYISTGKRERLLPPTHVTQKQKTSAPISDAEVV